MYTLYRETIDTVFVSVETPVVQHYVSAGGGTTFPDNFYTFEHF